MTAFVPPPTFDPPKQRLIDDAIGLCGRPARLADLGGVWNVAGAYARYARLVHGVESVTLADSDFDEETIARCGEADISILRGLLGDARVIDAVGRVDMTLLFDVLLHQVEPDWPELLERYAPNTSCFVVFNPQWAGPGSSFRLVDLGRERYFELVPHAPSEPGYDTFFDSLDDDYPAHGRLVRDVHYVWQWAVTDGDLRAVMQRLGFDEVLRADHGPFPGAERFARRGFVFRRA